MRRTERLQGPSLMKFEEVYGRCYRGELSQMEAAEVLGVSERTFRRWRDRYEVDGAEGLYDRCWANRRAGLARSSHTGHGQRRAAGRARAARPLRRRPRPQRCYALRPSPGGSDRPDATQAAASMRSAG